MSLESILNHILQDARAQAEKITQDARAEAERIIREAKSEADKIYREFLDGEKVMYEKQRQKLVVNARIESRKNLLRTKQELIDEAFKKLKSTLKADRFKKQQVLMDKAREVPEDVDFYLSKVRREFESEVAVILFS